MSLGRSADTAAEAARDADRGLTTQLAADHCVDRKCDFAARTWGSVGSLPHATASTAANSTL
jgi:hypothetical protein